MTSTASTGRRAARRAVVPIAIAAAIAASALGAQPASAAQQYEGWLRVAHLSPDTKSVDVAVTAVRGDEVVYRLSDVGYGAVSEYEGMPAGDYVVSMVPAGSDPGTPAMISQRLTVEPKSTSTVAAYGPNEDIDVKVFSDRLDLPKAKDARIRLIQASTVADEVSVETTTGAQIAENVPAGAATDYATVGAGRWTLELTGDGLEDRAKVKLREGSVTSLFVLDTADGGLTIMPVLDSASAGPTPQGGVQTGGGYLAEQHVVAPVGAAAAVLAAGVAGVRPEG